MANADGSQPVQLTSFGWYSDAPYWSPDGRWIAFESHSLEGRWDIWVMDAAGGTPRQLTKGPGSFHNPSFSHDARWVYFYGTLAGQAVSSAPPWPGEIFRAPFEGGAVIQLTHSGGSHPQQAVDGTTIYYHKAGALWQVPAAGGEERPVGIEIRPVYEVASDGVYFIAPNRDKDHMGEEIRFCDFATRTPRVLQALGDIERGTYWFTVSPDRKTFLYTVREGTGADLMLVENFR